MAHDIGKVGLHAKIRVRIPHRMLKEKPGEVKTIGEDGKMYVVETTAGRCIFNDILPKGMPFYNMTMAQKKLSQVISDCFVYCRQAPRRSICSTGSRIWASSMRRSRA